MTNNPDSDFVNTMLDLIDKQTTIIIKGINPFDPDPRDLALIQNIKAMTLTLKSFHEANVMLDLIRSHAREQADPSALLSSGS